MPCTHMQPATVRRRAPRPSAHMRCRPAALQRSAGLGALSRRGAHGRGPPAPALRCHGCGRACRQSLPVPRSPQTRGTWAVRRGRRRTVFRTGAQLNSSVAHVRQRAHSLRRPPRTAPPCPRGRLAERAALPQAAFCAHGKLAATAADLQRVCARWAPALAGARISDLARIEGALRCARRCASSGTGTRPQLT
jgi:hypothetical protein